jgi:hypothetical protein
VSAATLLDRLARVKQTRPHHYVAACPRCESKRGRPISLRVLEDGRALLWAFCGCETSDVLAVLGLSLTDLYPERLAGSGPAGGFPRSHSNIPARDLLEVLSQDTTTVALIAARMLERGHIESDEWQALAKAAARIGRARIHAYGR